MPEQIPFIKGNGSWHKGEHECDYYVQAFLNPISNIVYIVTKITRGLSVLVETRVHKSKFDVDTCKEHIAKTLEAMSTPRWKGDYDRYVISDGRSFLHAKWLVTAERWAIVNSAEDEFLSRRIFDKRTGKKFLNELFDEEDEDNSKKCG